MESNYEFLQWLSANQKWSQSTIGKYESATRITSAEMYRKGTINKSLFEMSKTELDKAIFFILNDLDFLKKDKIGNKMYSNGLKQYRSFIASTQDNIASDKLEMQIAEQELVDKNIAETERQAIIAARVGQGVFRKHLFDKYGKCVITGVDNPKLVIASHIKPWSQCDNIGRLNVENGILLTPTFDKLFDYGLITFTDKGKLLVSSFVGEQNEQRLHIPKNEIFDLKATKDLYLNMQYHNEILFVK